MSEDYSFSISGAIATLSFTRPDKANAFHSRMADPIRRLFIDLQHQSEVRCLVIRGEGKHFMAGGDLDTVSDLEGLTPSELTRVGSAPISAYNQMLWAMTQLQIPVIASVRGAVIGVAVGWVAACDLVIASEKSYLQAAHVLSGGSSDGLLTYFLPRQIGARKTLEIALLGDRIDAREAHRLNLVNFVVDDAALEAETAALAGRLASGPTRAYGVIKRLVEASFDNSFDSQGRMEAYGYDEMLHTGDLREGIQAFFEKRPPAFTGK